MRICTQFDRLFPELAEQAAGKDFCELRPPCLNGGKSADCPDDEMAGRSDWLTCPDKIELAGMDAAMRPFLRTGKTIGEAAADFPPPLPEDPSEPDRALVPPGDPDPGPPPDAIPQNRAGGGFPSRTGRYVYETERTVD